MRPAFWTVLYLGVAAAVWARALPWWWVALLVTIDAVASSLRAWDEALP